MPRRNKLRHPWLDANDPANTERLYRRGLPGFWVPTPEEIESAIAEIIKRSDEVKDERWFYRPPKECTLFNQRKKIDEEARLCDCPYWGTEFQE